MNDGQRRRCERDERVIIYMDASSEDFPADSKGAVLTGQLSELVAQVSALELERAASVSKRRQGTKGREAARTALRRMLKGVWETYKAITLDHSNLKGRFESPIKSTTDQALITTARVYVAAVAPHATLFAEYGVTAAFLNELRTQADTLETYTALQNTGVSAGVDATASVEEKLRQADDVVERLDAIVRNKYRADPAKLTTWASASHVERAPRRKPKNVNNGPPQTPPANT